MSETLTRIQALLVLSADRVRHRQHATAGCLPGRKAPPIPNPDRRHPERARRSPGRRGGRQRASCRGRERRGGPSGCGGKLRRGVGQLTPALISAISASVSDARRKIELRAERHTLERLLIERGEGQRVSAQGKFQPLPNGPETAGLRRWRKLDASSARPSSIRSCETPSGPATTLMFA